MLLWKTTCFQVAEQSQWPRHALRASLDDAGCPGQQAVIPRCFPPAGISCLTSLPFIQTAAIRPQSPRMDFCYFTWFIDGVGRFHASVDVVGYMAMQEPCPRVFCHQLNCLECPRKQVIHVSSVVLICLWQGKISIIRVLPYCTQMPHPRHWNITVWLFAPWGRLNAPCYMLLVCPTERN